MIKIRCSNCQQTVEEQAVNQSLKKFSQILCLQCTKKFQQAELEPSSNKELKGVVAKEG